MSSAAGGRSRSAPAVRRREMATSWHVTVPLWRPPMPVSATSSTAHTRRHRVPDIKHYVYRDGQPIHQLQYLQVKVILKGERFTCARSLRDFKVFVAEAAARADVDFDSNGYKKTPPRMREVLFLDTPD